MTATTKPRAPQRAQAGKPLLVPQKPKLLVPRHVAAARAAVPIAQALSSRHAIHARKRGFGDQYMTYEKPGADGDADPCFAADVALLKHIRNALQHWYPDQPWFVRVDHAQGIVAISLPVLMKRNFFEVLHTANLKADPGLKRVMRAAGRLLERLGLPRTGFALDRFLDARARGPYAKKPKTGLVLPDFPSSVRPRMPIEPLPVGALQA